MTKSAKLEKYFKEKTTDKRCEIVLEREAGITTKYSNCPILGTFLVTHGFAVALYDSKQKIAYLAHADNISQMNCIIAQVKKLKPTSKKTTVYLINGSNRTRFPKALFDFFDKKIDCHIRTTKFYNSDEAVLAIDARNGVFHDSTFSNYRIAETYKERIQAYSDNYDDEDLLNLGVVYDGRYDLDIQEKNKVKALHAKLQSNKFGTTKSHASIKKSQKLSFFNDEDSSNFEILEPPKPTLLFK